MSAEAERDRLAYDLWKAHEKLAVMQREVADHKKLKERLDSLRWAVNVSTYDLGEAAPKCPVDECGGTLYQHGIQCRIWDALRG